MTWPSRYHRGRVTLILTLDPYEPSNPLLHPTERRTARTQPTAAKVVEGGWGLRTGGLRAQSLHPLGGECGLEAENWGI